MDSSPQIDSSPEIDSSKAELTQLPVEHISSSEDLQIVHYQPGEAFGMHHDSSVFQASPASSQCTAILRYCTTIIY